MAAGPLWTGVPGPEGCVPGFPWHRCKSVSFQQKGEEVPAAWAADSSVCEALHLSDFVFSLILIIFLY